ncbi:MAG: hypothetical protein NTY19_18560, partial [Planctomycetota bacterium]|nr:hypothetical protein [Planctomycetota bacterium]
MKQNGLACALLVVTVLCAYWPVGRHEFVNFDDPQYLVDNPQVRQGLTWGGIRWAFTTGHAANWHPVTWLSHMIDCQLVGLQAGWHHVIGMLFHIANSVLLYLVFQRMTGAIWRSFMVAALFALHPLHVESVAWAAERKDVLSALFWILSLAAYVRYTAAPSWRSYGVVMVCFALGLMAKPMLVTLPCVLLLLDYWPLGRWSFEANRRVRLRLLIVEKLPLLALSAASCLVTMIVQSRGGAVGSVTAFPVTVRLANAVVAYVAYLGKLIWPTRLAVFYPYHAIATWQWMSAAAVLAGITAVAIITRRRWPYLLVGWLWYLGTLVPVIGVIQVGRQSMADRYTYLPLVGVFVMLVWWITELSARSRWSQSLLRVAAGTAIIVCLALSFLQVVRWRNSVTLFEHCLRVTGNNALAHTSLGADLRRRGWLDEAMTHYREALRI